MIGLRERITVQQPAHSSADGYNEPTVGWSDVATLWAKLENVAGVESVRGRRLADSARWMVTTRWIDATSGRMRLKWIDGATTRYLQPIGPPIADARRRELVWIFEEDGGV